MLWIFGNLNEFSSWTLMIGSFWPYLLWCIKIISVIFQYHHFDILVTADVFSSLGFQLCPNKICESQIFKTADMAVFFFLFFYQDSHRTEHDNDIEPVATSLYNYSKKNSLCVIFHMVAILDFLFTANPHN